MQKLRLEIFLPFIRNQTYGIFFLYILRAMCHILTHSYFETLILLYILRILKDPLSMLGQ